MKLFNLIYILYIFIFSLRLSDAVQIYIDTSKAPDLANYAKRVKSTLYTWFPKGAAEAAGSQIRGSVDYYRAHSESTGSMLHEMVHVIQAYKHCDSWVTEGIADYIRYYKFEPNNKPPKPDPKDNYTKGYGVAAYFLNYIVTRVRKDMVYYANKDCREGTYKESIWPRLTGKTLDRLWADMMRDEKN